MDHGDHDPAWWTRSVQDHLGPHSDISLMEVVTYMTTIGTAFLSCRCIGDTFQDLLPICRLNHVPAIRKTPHVKPDGEVCQDDSELRRVLTRGQCCHGSRWLRKLFYLNYNANHTLP